MGRANGLPGGAQKCQDRRGKARLDGEEGQWLNGLKAAALVIARDPQPIDAEAIAVMAHILLTEGPAPQGKSQRGKPASHRRHR